MKPGMFRRSDARFDEGSFMRIGIVVTAQQSSGGIFQYTHSILSALHSWDSSHEFVILVWKGNPLPWNQFSGERWRVEAMDPTIATQPQDVQPRLSADGIDLLESGVNQRAARFFQGLGIDLLIFPAPAALAFECGLPYFMAIHDLQHRLQPEFPEVSNGGVWQRREYLFRNGVRFAQGILVDSEVGKEDVLKFYGDLTLPERLHVLPFLPGQQVESEPVAEAKKDAIRRRHNLPERFLFYPAQFWLHKNHSRLIHAVHILRATYQIDAPLVLAGSNNGGPPEEARDVVFKNALVLAEQLGVRDLIHCLGYVGDDEMAPLYAQAAALAMPTFFGPTNIPVLEAWALGCPVLSSDIRGIRDQVGEAGVLVNPRDTNDIAKGLLMLWTDASVRRRCIEAGHLRFASYTARDFSRRLTASIARLTAPFRDKTTPSRGNTQSEQLRGFQYFEQKQWEQALACFDHVVEAEPQRQGLHHLRAQCLFALGRWKDCERAIFAELKIQPNHPDTRSLLRELRQQQKPVVV
jgi:glycosyltransferase involved in cell wall biosynthesis